MWPFTPPATLNLQRSQQLWGPVMDVKAIPLMPGALTGDVILASGEIPKQDWVRLDSRTLLQRGCWLQYKSAWLNRYKENIPIGDPQVIITINLRDSPSKLWTSQASGLVSVLPIKELPNLNTQISCIDLTRSILPANAYGAEDRKAHAKMCWRALKAICEFLHTGKIVWQPDQYSDFFIEHIIRLTGSMLVLPELKHPVFDLLFQVKNDLFASAQRKPLKYLNLGYILQNAAIFKEAAIHVISRWPCLDEDEAQEAMHSRTLRRFIMGKYEKLVSSVDQVHLRISHLEVECHKRAGKLDAEALLATSLFRTNFLHQIKILCASCKHEPGKGCTAGLVDLWLGFKMGEPRAFSNNEIKTSYEDSGMIAKIDTAKLAAYTKELTDAAAKIVDESLLESTLRARLPIQVKHRFLTGIRIKDSELPWLQSVLGKRRR